MEDYGIEIEPTQVGGISRLVEINNEIQVDDSHILRRPMFGNTSLSWQAFQSNYDIVVELIIDQSPNLLFVLSEYKDTPLHVAARAGNFHTFQKLLAAYADFQRPEIAMAWLKYTKSSKPVEDYDAEMNMEDLLGLVKMGNKEGNTVLHEAIYGNNILALVFKAFEPYNIRDRNGESLAESCYKYALDIVNYAKKSALYMAVEAGDKDVVKLVLDKCPSIEDFTGLSPVAAAIVNRDKAMLIMILEKKPEWLFLTDQNERNPLHYAAFIGYLEGVQFIVMKSHGCAYEFDKDGYYPIHLASYGGHVKVVEELLKYQESILFDKYYHRNILHIAAKNGKLAVVCYILKNTKLDELIINQRDYYGDTPLHLATRSCHPKIVYHFTWNDKIDLNLLNFNNQTPLDIINTLYELKGNPSIIETGSISPYQLEKGSVEQLTWIALKSAGAKRHSRLPVESRHKEKVSNPEGYSNRIENLTVISTLIITASVAACLAVPGEADGRAHNLYHSMFQVFIICIDVSLFSSISATIILLWARIGLIELVIYCIDIVLKLMGIALISLSMAFMAGLYTVVGELTWLASVFLGMNVIFIVVVSLLYTLLFFPSTSTNKIMRWISYYPFIILSTMAEPQC